MKGNWRSANNEFSIASTEYFNKIIENEKIVILQSSFIPWNGYFAMNPRRWFIHYDIVQFTTMIGEIGTRSKAHRGQWLGVLDNTYDNNPKK